MDTVDHAHIAVMNNMTVETWLLVFYHTAEITPLLIKKNLNKKFHIC